MPGPFSTWFSNQFGPTPTPAGPPVNVTSILIDIDALTAQCIAMRGQLNTLQAGLATLRADVAKLASP